MDAGTTPEFEAYLNRAREFPIQSFVADRKIALKRIAKNEFAGACPVCGGQDRFSVNPAEGLFNCRGCQKGGDVIELVQ